MKKLLLWAILSALVALLFGFAMGFVEWAQEQGERPVEKAWQRENRYHGADVITIAWDGSKVAYAWDGERYRVMWRRAVQTAK